MCGRLACNLCPTNYQKACSYENESKKFIQPEWIDLENGGFMFQPSNNVCPSDVTPVLVPGSRFHSKSKRCLAPMLWGMIPSWHKGAPKKHGLSTSNCRIESIKNSDFGGGSKMYLDSLRQGKRCVVVCEGYYEWALTKYTNRKQPYYVYAKQNDVQVEDETYWKTAEWSSERGWQGPSILKVAALYDVWKDQSNQKEIHSYSIITMDSNNTLSWLHHRMPAVLETENYVQDWLDSDRVPSSTAISMLIAATNNLSWHPVSTHVNDSRNKDSQCKHPLSTSEPPFSPLKNWLVTGVMKRPSDENQTDGVEEMKKLKS